MKNTHILKTVYSALFAALVFAGTQFLRVPLPFGYFNLGDCFVLLSAAIIGGPYAILASAVGAAMADVLSGYMVYVPATLLIKALMAAAAALPLRLCRGKGRRIPLFAVGAVLAELVMVCGYFLCDAILYSLPGALASLSGNLLQGVAAVAVSIPLLAALESRGPFKQTKG